MSAAPAPAPAPAMIRNADAWEVEFWRARRRRLFGIECSADGHVTRYRIGRCEAPLERDETPAQRGLW